MRLITVSRNRTEAYHQLQRMIRKVHSGVFPGRKIVANAVYRQADPPLEFGTLVHPEIGVERCLIGIR